MDSRVFTFPTAFCISVVAAAAVAQEAANDFKDAVALAVHRGSGQAFIAELSGRLLRWDGENTAVLVDDLHSQASLERIVAITCRDGNKVTVVGTATLDGDKHLRFATFEVGLEKPASLIETHFGDLPLEEGEEFSAFASTDLAVYLATKSEKASHLYRLEPTRAKNEETKAIFTDLSATITALAIDAQGHLVAAVSDSSKASQLRFHHGTSGRRLLLVPTNAKDINSLSFSQTGLLYGSCLENDQRGIYRFDALLENGRQKVRAVRVGAIEDVLVVACADNQLGVALVGGERHAKAVKVRLD